MNVEGFTNNAPSTPLTTTQENSNHPNNNSNTNGNNNNNANILPHRQRTFPRLRSNLSAVDSRFIELTRCLYQAKTIVQDLNSFYASVLPTLSLSTYHDPTHSPQQRVGSVAFLQHIKQYLDDNFTKFTKLCKVLMMILSRLEQNAQVKQERIQSFRNEIMDEWRTASDIKRRIQTYLHQNNSLFDGSASGITAPTTPLHDPLQPSSATAASRSNVSLDQLQQQQQHHDRRSPLTSPKSSSRSFDTLSRHSLQRTATADSSSYSPFQVPDMASGSILESMSCSESPPTGQIGSPTSTISG